MIDWSCVKTLIDEIGEVDFGEVVPLFLAEMDESVDNLASAQADGALPQTLHFLKGSSSISDSTVFQKNVQRENRPASAARRILSICHICSIYTNRAAARFFSVLKKTRSLKG